MVTMEIQVLLDEKQSEMAFRHYGEERMNNFIEDIQGTVRNFLDTLAKEEEEVKPKTTAIITPIGVFEFED